MTDQTNKLEPCPFCGGEVVHIQGFSPLSQSHFIDCESCGASSPIKQSKEEAFTVWNRRASAPADKAIPMKEIANLVTWGMDEVVKNGANSTSMPDDLVAVAYFIAHPHEFALGAPAAGSVPSSLSIVELARFHAIDHEHWSPERIEAFAADVLAQYGRPAIPDVLFDGPAVLQALDGKAKGRTSAENVSDVLDAVVRVLRARASAPQEGK